MPEACAQVCLMLWSVGTLTYKQIDFAHHISSLFDGRLDEDAHA